MAKDIRLLALGQLKQDPMFPYLPEQEQRLAVEQALKRAGNYATPRPEDVDTVFRAAIGTPTPPPPSTLTPETVLYEPRPMGMRNSAPPSAHPVLADILEAVPYTHRFLGDVLGCSRQMVSMIVSGSAEERLTYQQRANLAAVLKETIRRAQAVLERVEPPA